MLAKLECCAARVCVWPTPASKWAVQALCMHESQHFLIFDRVVLLSAKWLRPLCLLSPGEAGFATRSFETAGNQHGRGAEEAAPGCGCRLVTIQSGRYSGENLP